MNLYDHYGCWSGDQQWREYLFLIMIIRQGYEHYENDLLESLSFLKDYAHEVIEQRTDGSFYTYTVALKDCAVEMVRYYYEFIEQQLIVTINMSGVRKTTLMLNKEMHLGFSMADMYPEGDNYQNALKGNAAIILYCLKKDA
jgi:hypothetical protein